MNKLINLEFHKYAIGPVQEMSQPNTFPGMPEHRLLNAAYTPGWAFKSKQLKRQLPRETYKKLKTNGYLQLPNPEAYRAQIEDWTLGENTPMPNWIRNSARKTVDKVTPEVTRTLKRHEIVHYLRSKQFFGDTPNIPSIPTRIKEEAIAYWHQRPKASKLRRSLDVIKGVPISTIFGHFASKNLLKRLGK